MSGRRRPALLVRARFVLPVSRPPISDGGVLVQRGRIAAVGPWKVLKAQAKSVDLGEVVLMPGLVNAHCHLDYTLMGGQFPPPKVFTDWLKAITATKAGWGYADYVESWTRGAEMLLRTGTTTVGDVEAVPQLLPESWSATPLRVFSFLEMIGLTGKRSPMAIVQESVERIRALTHHRCRAGLSPHAPYSTLPELLRLSAQTAQEQKWRLTTHVAESALEFEMFTRGGGAMFDWLERSARDMSDCGLGSPVEHLDRCGLLSQRLLAVHVNYLRRGDARLLAERGVHVAHCPRSHAYFKHEKFPLRRLLRAGVNVCLGTDSLATVVKRRKEALELSLFEEMSALAEAHPWMSPNLIVQMASMNGARALGMAGVLGELVPGANADLIVLPYRGGKRGLYEAIVGHRGNVLASMIEGQWVFGMRGDRIESFASAASPPSDAESVTPILRQTSARNGEIPVAL